MIKRRQGTAARPARGATYGLRYLNPGVDLGGADPGIGFNYLGRLGAGAGELSEDMWRIGDDSLELGAAATAIDMPLMHTVELNAGTLDTDAGPQLQASWTWAPSAVDAEQIDRLGRFVVRGAGRDLRPRRFRRRRVDPSDLLPAKLSQTEIDELSGQYAVADVLPLTPLQRGLLFQSAFAERLRRRRPRRAAGAHGHRRSGHRPVARRRGSRWWLAIRTWRHGSSISSASRSRFSVDPQIAFGSRSNSIPMSSSASSSCAPRSGPRSAISPDSRPSGRR